MQKPRNTKESFGLEFLLQRAGGASFLLGNQVSLLQDGPQVFDAWEKEVKSAKNSILFANYIISNDQTGRRWINLIAQQAKRGVQVYFLYDWFGSFGTDLEFWQELEKAGAFVYCFNLPRFSNPLSSIVRYHGKVLVVDGTIGFVGGLCVGNDWMGDKKANIEPWRDTAVRLEGPIVQSLEYAFKEAWSQVEHFSSIGIGSGDTLQKTEYTSKENSSVQLIAGYPGAAKIYRVIQVLLSAAISRIWITDAYFSTPRSMYEALIFAAKEGVDVRLLVPRHSDVPGISWWGRAGYKGLLEAGVKIYEWEGTMLHAKSIVVDGYWSKIGSSNLNLISLNNSWEVDVIVQDHKFGQEMEEMFLRDIKNSSELVLSEGAYRLVHLGENKKNLSKIKPRKIEKAKAAMIRAGVAMLGGAIQRQFSEGGLSWSGILSVLLFTLAGVGFYNPWFLALPVIFLSLWGGWVLMGRVFAEIQRRIKQRKKREDNFEVSV